MRERARGYLEAIAAKGGGELISEFCVPLPALTFLVALGGPLDDVGAVARVEVPDDP